MNTRTAQLYAAAEAFTRAHHAWTNDNNRPHPDATYWDSLEALIQVFESGDVPAECRALANAVHELTIQLHIFDTLETIEPSDQFWIAREAVERAHQNSVEPKEVNLESMKELHDQGVSHEQIARIYGLVDREGRGKSHLVDKELQTPGSVIGPDWKHPDAQTQATVAAQATQASKRLQEIAAPACPETPEELYLQGVSAGQAAKMLQWSLDKTQQEWELFRLQDEEQKRSNEIDRLKAGGSVDSATSAALSQAAPSEPAKVTIAKPVVASDEADPDADDADDDIDEDDEDYSDLEDDEDEDATDALDANLQFESLDVDRLKSLCNERGIGLRPNERKAGMIAKLRALAKSQTPATAG